MKSQVLWLLLAAVVVPATLVSGVQAVHEYQQVQKRQQDRLRLSVRLTATSIDQFVAAHAAAVALTAKASSSEDPPDLASLRSLFPALGTSLATDADGRIVAASPAALLAQSRQASVADRDYFRAVANGLESYVSDAFRGRGFGTNPLVAVSAPLIHDGRFAGIVQGSIDVGTFTAMRSSALRLRGQEMLVVDRAGHVIHASAGLPFRFLQPVGDARFLRGDEAPDGVSPVTVDADTLSSEAAWVAWTELRSGWRLVIFEPQGTAFAGVYRHGLQTALLLLLTSALVLLIANWQINRIARAVHTALRTLRAIASGDEPSVVRIDRVPLELQPVTEQVLKLAQRLHDSNRSLAASLAKEEALSHDLLATNLRLEETVRARTDALERANEELARASRTDALTGALNLRGLEERYAELTDGESRLVRRVGIVMFDVDFFKRYNDRYGHPAGDRVLRRLAAVASSELRAGLDCLARIGGEEFLICLPDADADLCQRVAERVRATIHALGIPHADGCGFCVTVSVGCAAGEVGEGLEAILGLADEALYLSKAEGRNQVSGATAAVR